METIVDTSLSRLDLFKRLYVAAMTCFTLCDSAEEESGDFAPLWKIVDDPAEAMLILGAELLGCHAVIEADAEVLQSYDLHPGMTYHEVVLQDHMSHLLDTGNFAPDERVRMLHKLFLSDQAYRGQDARDVTAFQAWMAEWGENNPEVHRAAANVARDKP